MGISADIVAGGGNIVTGNATLAMLEFPPFIYWAVGIMTLAVIVAGVRQEYTNSRLRKICDKLGDVTDTLTIVKTMQEHPEDYGFGTKRTNELLEENLRASTEAAKQSAETSRAIRALTHYIMEEMRTRGHNPLPPTGS